MMRYVTAGLLAALVAIISPTGGRAQATASPDDRIDGPTDWRFITRSPTTTTSTCIGDPLSPVCAVETLEACKVRADPQLCNIARGGDDGPKVRLGANPSKEIPASYRVAELRPPSDEDKAEFDDRYLLSGPDDMVVGVVSRIYTADAGGGVWGIGC